MIWPIEANKTFRFIYFFFFCNEVPTHWRTPLSYRWDGIGGGGGWRERTNKIQRRNNKNIIIINRAMDDTAVWLYCYHYHFYRLSTRRLHCSAVQGELSQAGRNVGVQVGPVVGRHVGVHVRQQEMARARYVVGKSNGQTRPTPFLEREARGLHQEPVKQVHPHD